MRVFYPQTETELHFTQTPCCTSHIGPSPHNVTSSLHFDIYVNKCHSSHARTHTHTHTHAHTHTHTSPCTALDWSHSTTSSDSLSKVCSLSFVTLNRLISSFISALFVYFHWFVLYIYHVPMLLYLLYFNTFLIVFMYLFWLVLVYLYMCRCIYIWFVWSVFTFYC